MGDAVFIQSFIMTLGIVKPLRIFPIPKYFRVVFLADAGVPINVGVVLTLDNI